VFDAANPLLYDTGAAVQVGTNGLRPTADGYYIVEFSLRGKFIAPSTIAVPGAGPVINVQLLVNGMTNEPLGSPTSPTQYANTNDALWSTDIRKVNVTKVIRLAQTDLVQLELYIDSTDFSASFQHFGLELGLTYLGPV
jgi:hypothetical protein